MVFGRCAAVESDLFFSSSAIRTAHSARASASPRTSSTPSKQTTPSHRRSESAAPANTSSSSIMPTILNWARKSSNASSSVKSDRPTNESVASNNQEPSPQRKSKGHHSHHHHQRRHQKKDLRNSTAVHSGGVTFRRGDKSFLEFHQNYAITRHLGEGSYSTVKQVTHRKRGGTYACKIVDKNALSPVDRVALGHEVEVLASVRHDHVMRLYEVIEDDDKCYLIMEIAENGDLFDKIVKQGKFPEHEAQKVTAALCEALHYCHANAIIHRDVKPENVLLSSDPHAIKLCDFGFAKQLRSVTEKSVDSCGTPGYAAPEILDGKPYGLEVDVFSLGVVTYIMLCGYPPFPMKLSQLRSHRFNVRFPSKDWASVDTSVKDMITRMLHVKPDLRPKMSELKEHPWIKRGKEILDQARLDAEKRKIAEAMQQKQFIADTIRKKLTSTTGFEVVKHGRQGQPHRTKLRLSTDGRVLSWQPKLFKRGLLKYQNAKSITSFFGFGSKSAAKQTVAHPQISRLSSLEGTRSAEGGRFSEPILCDDSERSAIVSSVVRETQARASGSQQLSKTDSTNSTTSTGSANWIDKKNWWRSFRGSGKTKPGGQSERSASGGVSFAAFSFTTNQPPAASRSVSSSSSCSGVSDSYDSPDPTGSRISVSSEPTSPTSHVSPQPHATPPMSPTVTATTERMLDSSILLKDIRSVTLGEDSSFFQGKAGCCCCNETCGKADASATASAFDGDDGDDGDDDESKRKPGELNPATAMTVATRYRELHLEFSSQEIRDAFAYLLEQSTLPLEEVSQQQPSFIFRCPSTPPSLMKEAKAPAEQPEDIGLDENNNTSE